jgi:hypothetical protein
VGVRGIAAEHGGSGAVSWGWERRRRKELAVQYLTTVRSDQSEARMRM